MGLFSAAGPVTRRQGRPSVKQAFLTVPRAKISGGKLFHSSEEMLVLHAVDKLTSGQDSLCTSADTNPLAIRQPAFPAILMRTLCLLCSYAACSKAASDTYGLVHRVEDRFGSQCQA